jgi:hypothetical protein
LSVRYIYIAVIASMRHDFVGFIHSRITGIRSSRANSSRSCLEISFLAGTTRRDLGEGWHGDYVHYAPVKLLRTLLLPEAKHHDTTFGGRRCVRFVNQPELLMSPKIAGMHRTLKAQVF